MWRRIRWGASPPFCDPTFSPAIGNQFVEPIGIAVSPLDEVYFAEVGCCRIRTVDMWGNIYPVLNESAFCGGFSPDGTDAVNAVAEPFGVALHGGEVLYTAEMGHRVRKVDLNGKIQTLAGSGIRTHSLDGLEGPPILADDLGDGGLATNATLDHPRGVAADSAGTPFIADTFNHRIRSLVSVTVPPPTVALTSSQYCISGLSSGAAYSWWLDLLDDAANMPSEPSNLAAGPVLPAGASEAALATDFADNITVGCTAKGLTCNATASGSCFDLFVEGMCSAGSPNPSAACASDADCEELGICGGFHVCVSGSDLGEACTVDAECGALAGTCLTGHALYVGPAGLTPTCKVTMTGCQYNPVITLGPPHAVPAVSPWGLTLLILGLVTAGSALLYLRRAPARGTTGPSHTGGRTS
jgi:hypothetical protein